MKILTIVITLFFMYSIDMMAFNHDVIESGFSEDINVHAADSVSSLNLITDFYTHQGSLARSYEFELLNKKKKYEKWSKDTQIFGYGLTLAIEFAGGFLAVNNHWSLGWYLPTATVIGCGLIYGSLKLSYYYADKASIIQISPLYSFNINSTLSIQALSLTSFICPKKIGLGLGITTIF